MNVVPVSSERVDFTGVTFNIACIFQRYYMAVELNKEMLGVLQYVMNFTYILKDTTDWGSYNKTTGKWNGMIELLLNGEADFSITHAVSIPARTAVVDFTLSSSTFRFAALYRQPSFRKNELALLKPFTASLWLAILAWCVVVAVALVSMQFATSKIVHEDVENTGEENGRPNLLADCILYAISTVCRQDHVSLIKSSVQRKDTSSFAMICLIITGALATLTLHAAYGANLFTFLSLREDATGRLDHLESMKYYSFAIDNETSFLLEQKVQGALPSLFLSEYLSRPKVLASYVEERAKHYILKGLWVSLAEDWRVYKFLETKCSLMERCSLDMALLPMEPLYRGQMLPKGSPYKRSIDSVILKTLQFGLKNLWDRRYIPGRLPCDFQKMYEPVPVLSVWAALYVLSAGLILTAFILVVERVL